MCDTRNLNNRVNIRDYAVCPRIAVGRHSSSWSARTAMPSSLIILSQFAICVSTAPSSVRCCLARQVYLSWDARCPWIGLIVWRLSESCSGLLPLSSGNLSRNLSQPNPLLDTKKYFLSFASSSLTHLSHLWPVQFPSRPAPLTKLVVSFNFYRRLLDKAVGFMVEILVTRCLRRNKGRNWQRKLKKMEKGCRGVIRKSGGGRRVGGCFILTE